MWNLLNHAQNVQAPQLRLLSPSLKQWRPFSPHLQPLWQLHSLRAGSGPVPALTRRLRRVQIAEDPPSDKQRCQRELTPTFGGPGFDMPTTCGANKLTTVPLIVLLSSARVVQSGQPISSPGRRVWPAIVLELPQQNQALRLLHQLNVAAPDGQRRTPGTIPPHVISE